MKTLLAQKNIPQGWELKALGSLVSIKKGEQLNRSVMDDAGKYPALNGGISPSGYTDKWNTEVDTITISEGGNSCGYVNLNKERFWRGGHCYALLGLNKNVDNNFLYQALKFKQDQLMELRVGSGLPNIQKKSIEGFPLLFPESKNEQQKIAEILKVVDKEIEKIDQIIAATEKLKKGLMQQLFTRGIGHTKFKKTKIGEIPEEWLVSRFDSFITLQRGFDLPANQRIAGLFPLVSSNGITDTHMEAKINGPGVITGRSGTIGGVFYERRNFWPLNTTLYVKDFHDNIPKFIYYFLWQFNLSRFHSGTGVPTLNRNDVHSELIAFPKAKKEQQKIVEILSSTDEKISVNKKLKEKLNLLKKGLMQDLLSGKVRVK